MAHKNANSVPLKVRAVLIFAGREEWCFSFGAVYVLCFDRVVLIMSLMSSNSDNRQMKRKLYCERVCVC